MKMKQYIMIIAIMAGVQAMAQDNSTGSGKRVYTTSSGELIFSAANVSLNGDEEESVLRFSPVVNIQNWVNIDKSDNFGLFTGLSVRNVGVIYDQDASTRIKARTYNLGIPIGIKLGNLAEKFVFVGYELEIPVNYKEKTFIDEDKESKKNIWFSDRVNTINHSLMAGVQLPYGATLKFKYYLTNFYNKDFKSTDDQGNTVKPYADTDINIFYVSLSFGLLKNTDFYYNND
jgi:hypothetical protein